MAAHQTKLPWREESGGAATLSGLGKQGAGGLKGMMDMEEGKEGGAGGMEEDVYEFVTSSKEATPASSQGSASPGSKGEGKEEARQQGKRGKEEGEEGKQRKKWKEEGIGAGRGHGVRVASMEKMAGEVAGSRGRGAATQADRKSPPAERAVEPPGPASSSNTTPSRLPAANTPSRPVAVSTPSCPLAASTPSHPPTANTPSCPMEASTPPSLAASTPSRVNPSIFHLGGVESGDIVDSVSPQAQDLAVLLGKERVGEFELAGLGAVTEENNEGTKKTEDMGAVSEPRTEDTSPMNIDWTPAATSVDPPRSPTSSLPALSPYSSLLLCLASPFPSPAVSMKSDSPGLAGISPTQSPSATSVTESEPEDRRAERPAKRGDRGRGRKPKPKKFLDNFLSDSEGDEDDPPYPAVAVEKKPPMKAWKKCDLFDKVIVSKSEEVDDPKDELKTDDETTGDDKGAPTSLPTNLVPCALLPELHLRAPGVKGVLNKLMSPSRPLAANTPSRPSAANKPSSPMAASTPPRMAASTPPRMAASTPPRVNLSIFDLGGREESGDMVDSVRKAMEQQNAFKDESVVESGEVKEKVKVKVKVKIKTFQRMKPVRMDMPGLAEQLKVGRITL